MTDDRPIRLAAKLRASGLRVTAPRFAVFQALPDGQHLPVDAIAATARAQLGALSTQAVYDILRVLVQVGLVRRIEPAGSPALFETRVGDNHHHVVCRRCSATVDIDCALGQAPCLEPSNAGGYEVDEAEVTFWGWCPSCRPSATSTRRGTA